MCNLIQQPGGSGQYPVRVPSDAPAAALGSALPPPDRTGRRAAHRQHLSITIGPGNLRYDWRGVPGARGRRATPRGDGGGGAAGFTGGPVAPDKGGDTGGRPLELASGVTRCAAVTRRINRPRSLCGRLSRRLYWLHYGRD